jgi:hypothetical protein
MPRIVKKPSSDRPLIPVALFTAVLLLVSSCQSSGEETAATGAGAASSSADSDPAIRSEEATASDQEERAETETGDVDPTDATGDGGTDSRDSTDDDGSASASDGQPPDLASTDGADSIAGSLLAEAVAAASAADSFAFEGGIEFSGPGADGTGSAVITFSGARDEPAGATRLNADLSGLGGVLSEIDGGEDLAFFEMFFTDPIQLVVIGDTAWISWDLFSMFVPPDKAEGDFWIELASEEGGAMVDDLGAGSGVSDPLELLESLKNITADIENVGPDIVRGDEVTHYRMMLDLRQVAEALPADQDIDVGEGVPADFDAVVPIDFWLDGEQRLRRVSMSLDDPEMLEEAEISGVHLYIELFDYGQPMAIEPPPVDQVLTEDDLGFSFSDDF